MSSTNGARCARAARLARASAPVVVAGLDAARADGAQNSGHIGIPNSHLLAFAQKLTALANNRGGKKAAGVSAKGKGVQKKGPAKKARARPARMAAAPVPRSHAAPPHASPRARRRSPRPSRPRRISTLTLLPTNQSARAAVRRRRRSPRRRRRERRTARDCVAPAVARWPGRAADAICRRGRALESPTLGASTSGCGADGQDGASTASARLSAGHTDRTGT